MESQHDQLRYHHARTWLAHLAKLAHGVICRRDEESKLARYLRGVQTEECRDTLEVNSGVNLVQVLLRNPLL